jgi:GAF domain-containing protein
MKFDSTTKRIFQNRDLTIDDREVPVEVRSSTIIIDGTEMVISAVRDMTERLRAQSTLRHRQAALEAIYQLITSPNATFQDMADTIAWSINSLLKIEHVVIKIRQGDQYRGVSRVTAATLYKDEMIDIAGDPSEAMYATGRIFQVQGSLDNLYPDARYFKEYPGLQSYIGIPLRDYAGVIRGDICLFDRQQRYFDDDDCHLLEIFGRFIAAELDHQRMERARGVT